MGKVWLLLLSSYSIIIFIWGRINSYRFFSIHRLHPQPPVGLRERLQGDDAMSAEKRSHSSIYLFYKCMYLYTTIGYCKHTTGNVGNTALQSSFHLTSPPPRCRSRSVCRLNPSFSWHTSAAWTPQERHSQHRSVNRDMSAMNTQICGTVALQGFLQSLLNTFCCIPLTMHFLLFLLHQNYINILQ